MVIIENGLNQILVYVRGQVDMEFEDVDLAMNTIRGLARKNIKIILNIDGAYINISMEAIKHLFRHRLNHCVDGLAIVLNSLPNRILMNSFIKHSPHDYPKRIFMDNSSAENWLESISVVPQEVV